MAVLKGELATKQSISLIKAFQQMKDYIIESNNFLLNTNPYIESKSIYHCGASCKDAGKRITTINKIEEKELYKPLIEEILTNGDLDM